jgi:hypothetical protein
LTAVLSGEISFYLIGSAGTVVPHVKAGRIRALGVGAKQRIAVLPDAPPIADALPGYEARGWNGILAPAGTPRPVIDRLHREIVKDRNRRLSAFDPHPRPSPERRGAARASPSPWGEGEGMRDGRLINN